jgi:hypothetical protein
MNLIYSFCFIIFIPQFKESEFLKQGLGNFQEQIFFILSFRYRMLNFELFNRGGGQVVFFISRTYVFITQVDGFSLRVVSLWIIITEEYLRVIDCQKHQCS